MNEIKKLFEETFQVAPTEIIALAGAGSSRRYRRLRSISPDGDPFSVIATQGENVCENRAFVGLSKVFGEAGVNVPEIYAVSADGRCYLQRDLGDTCLLDIIRRGDLRQTENLLRKAIDGLVRMQSVPGDKWRKHIFERPFGIQQMMWDLNYFKYDFLKPAGIDYDDYCLEEDFNALCRNFVRKAESGRCFMMRDCQSRNIMVCGDDLYFIDYQVVREGYGIYDAVSLLYQAKAGLPEDMRMSLMRYYACRFADSAGADPDDILAALPECKLMRMMQVLGAYGLRGLVERKAHFVESIPAGVTNFVEAVRSVDAGCYPELHKVASRLEGMERFRKSDAGDRLTVRVFSFSYKKGYPEDLSGNGGGFMFDCRAMHNPGRYDEYRHLTGLDKPVIDFLEERGEVQEFLKNACGLVMPAVERYRSRGFTSLQIGFGCTGGRHRSVYCAAHIAEELVRRFPDVRVELLHREQDIKQIFND